MAGLWVIGEAFRWMVMVEIEGEDRRNRFWWTYSRYILDSVVPVIDLPMTRVSYQRYEDDLNRYLIILLSQGVRIWVQQILIGFGRSGTSRHGGSTTTDL